VDLQELITRGRFLFSRAPSRLKIYELVNGRRTSSDIARLAARRPSNVGTDLKTLTDAGLIQPRVGRDEKVMKKGGSTVYEKVPLARTVPLSYFTGAAQPALQPTQKAKSATISQSRAGRRTLPVPSETDILDLCRSGEDQTHEFKAQGTEARKLAKEVAALLTTQEGGMIVYGVDDDGAIQGTDLKRQELDQRLQNALLNSIAPAPVVKVHSVKVLGNEVLVIIAPPWDRRNVYQYEGRVYIRKGTNAFQATHDESKRLHGGHYVV
jgi:hypothetical protein